VTLNKFQANTLFAEIELTTEAAKQLADWLESGAEFRAFGIGIDEETKVKIVARAYAVAPETEVNPRPETAAPKKPQAAPAKKAPARKPKKA
jgi:hypothetical protein